MLLPLLTETPFFQYIASHEGYIVGSTEILQHFVAPPKRKSISQTSAAGQAPSGLGLLGTVGAIPK